MFLNTSLSVVFLNTSFLKSFWISSALRALLTAGLSERVNVAVHVSVSACFGGLLAVEVIWTLDPERRRNDEDAEVLRLQQFRLL